MKRCSKCGLEKPLDQFHKGDRYKDGHRGTCKACAHQQVKDWQHENQAKVKASQQRTWLKHRDKRNAERRKPPREKIGRKESTRRYYEKNKAKHKEYSKKWWKENPIKLFLKKMRRRARERDAEGTATPEQIQARIDQYGGKCWICGNPYKEIDHVIPLAKGGTNYAANLRPICKSCNSRKQDRDWRKYAPTVET